VDATNLVQDQFITHLACTRAALPARVVGGRSDRAAVLGEHPADRRDSEPVAVGVDERGHHGSRGSSTRAKKDDAASRISLARFSSRTSACSVLIEAASVLVVPGQRPSSIWARRTHPRNVSGTTPTFGAILFTAAFNDNDESSLIASATNRCARSRSSSGYFLGAGITPPFRGITPSTKPGAVHAAVELGLSNSKLEGLNSKIRLINHRGYGHHSAAALIAMIYLCCGELTIQLPTER
jgi:hypothetical protein